MNDDSKDQIHHFEAFNVTFNILNATLNGLKDRPKDQSHRFEQLNDGQIEKDDNPKH